MNEREALAELLAPHCRGILDRIAGEARAAGDPARRLPGGELRARLDVVTSQALAALALPSDERREKLAAIVGAGRRELDLQIVPRIARIGLARLGLRLARAAVERELSGRPDAAALHNELAAFEADVLAVLNEAVPVA
ncbi:MAG: hypothetical protein NVS9B6_19820 [Candidatus Limnocylindrales bacterium]